MVVPNRLLGASISRPKALGFRHRGTCVDPGCLSVVDTLPETGARLVPQSVFSDGFTARIDSVGLTSTDQQIRAARALSNVGLPYSQANCDVLATYAETGVPSSPQLNQVLSAVFFGLAAGALLSWVSKRK
jgi:hypothetical protein